MTVITCPIGKCNHNVGFTCIREKLELSKIPWIIVTGMCEYEARCRPEITVDETKRRTD